MQVAGHSLDRRPRRPDRPPGPPAGSFRTGELRLSHASKRAAQVRARARQYLPRTQFNASTSPPRHRLYTGESPGADRRHARSLVQMLYCEERPDLRAGYRPGGRPLRRHRASPHQRPGLVTRNTPAPAKSSPSARAPRPSTCGSKPVSMTTPASASPKCA